MAAFLVSSARVGRGGERNLYLGFGEFFQRNSHGDSPEQTYLSLGESPSDWLMTIEADARRIYEALLKETGDYLSEFYGEPISTRQAEILTGHLAKVFAWRSARAISQIMLALQLEPKAKMLGTILNFAIPRNTREAIALVSSADFGAHLETLLFSQLSKNEVDVIYKSHDAPSTNHVQPCNWKSKILYFAGRVLAPITRSQSFALIEPRLGLVRELIINFRLGQMPIFPLDCEVGLNQKLSALKAADLAKARPSTHGEELIREFLRLVPTSLVEGHQTLKDQAVELGWPSNPRVIFTSTRFAYDDVFKLYVSRKVDNSQYWVGQHGNNYFTSLEQSICPELETSNMFLSWGHESVNVVPVGQLFRSRIRSRFRSRGVAIVLQGDLPTRTYCDWGYRQHMYLNSIENLIVLLSQSEVESVLCLAPGTSRELSNLLYSRLSGLSGVSISQKPLKKVLKSGFLPLFTFDSTGMLELASQLQPFLVFLPEKLTHIAKTFVPNYQSLLDDGLMALDTTSAHRIVLANLGARNENGIKSSLQFFCKGIVNPFRARLPLELGKLLLQSGMPK